MTDSTAAAQTALVAHLQEAQASDIPLTLITGETSWPDVDIMAIEEGWVTIRYTVWKGNAGSASQTGYSQIARLRADAITAFLYPLPQR
ncbi:MAG TPA: hypothetical protein PLI79_13215 [Mycobacterium sp.]|jgi:hypothetical protein|nr:hypothetical protein [Mycobacterium sp.]TXH13032.1 MAG: hypothetical protein E6R02_03715 [Gammaproteobacteria bacterium]HQC77885.1 hypothetical protein [Mycobacterium sp.]HRD12815.1 hypothetical protein [Mycobacterium sp.]